MKKDLHPLDFFYKSDNDIPAHQYYVYKHGYIPCVQYSYDNYHLDTIVSIVKEKYPNTQDSLKARNYTGKHFYTNSQLLMVEEGLYVALYYGSLSNNYVELPNVPFDNEDEEYNVCSISIYYAPEKEAQVETLLKEIDKSARLVPKNATSLHIVCKSSGGGYYLNLFEIKTPNLNLGLNYGAGFLPVHEKISERLATTDDKGIVLLHGIPGSGKTFYIRYLITHITEKKMIYVPPDMTRELSSPEFIPFLTDHPNSVLIIEDAENIIRDRKHSENQAVANLLNLSDGLLGDCLNFQIIATFNSDLTQIDRALLRKGRLIAEWKFDKLTIEDAQKVADHLGIEESITEPKTLAELYSYHDNVGAISNTKKIGF